MTAAGELKLRRVDFECPACSDSGYPLDERLGVEGRYSREAADRSDFERQSVERLRNDLAEHQHQLNDAERLQTGQSIGSGQVEGGCKNMIGRRLKQTGARWRVRRVNRQAGLCSLMDSDQWNPYREAPENPNAETRACTPGDGRETM